MGSVRLTLLRRVKAAKGDILHCLKMSDDSFAGFGEAYISLIAQGEIKGWKRHTRMVSNLTVVSGSVQFVVYSAEEPRERLLDVCLGPDDEHTHRRLTIPPGVWFAFKGLRSGDNAVLNVASILHDPTESENLDVAALAFDLACGSES